MTEKYQKLKKYLKERKKDLQGIKRHEGRLSPEGVGMFIQIRAIEQVVGEKF